MRACSRSPSGSPAATVRALPARHQRRPSISGCSSWTGGGVRSKPEATFALQIQAASLPIPASEYRFAPPRRFLFDFAWPAHLIAVEIYGGMWVGGRARRHGGERDMVKGNIAALL